MSAIDKFLNFMNLNDGEDDFYDEDDYYDDDVTEEAPPKKIIPIKETHEEDERRSRIAAKMVPSKSNRKSLGSNGMEVCIIKPHSVDEAREITETLLANRTVVLNLEGLDVDIAQRIIDYTSGSCYAIDGNLQKISHYIFIVTPNSVDISGDFQEMFTGAFDVPPINNSF